MENNDHFSVSQLPNYSTEKVAAHLNAFLERSRIIGQLRVQYNDKVRAYLADKSLSQEDRLSLAETWSGMRDTAKDMSEEAVKKAWACRVELDLRERE